MSSRRRADQLAAAIRSNFEARPAAPPAHPAIASDEVKRTTFSAPSAVIDELRHLALRRHCTMNALIRAAIEDLLKSIRHGDEVAVSPADCERIKERRRPDGSDAD